MNKVVVIIPSRYQSTRLPGKPLLDICGKPMIQHVYERCLAAKGVDAVYVATDHSRIAEAVRGFGGRAVMTPVDCACGTDRVTRCASVLGLPGDTVVVNAQGDEPLIDSRMIAELVSAFDDPDIEMATLKRRLLDPIFADDPNVVKVATDEMGDALYFSRSRIPYNRDDADCEVFAHVGIYGYRRTFLDEFSSMVRGRLEVAESLEQLRVLENGRRIRVVETAFDSVGVDTAEDLDRVRAIISAQESQ